MFYIILVVVGSIILFGMANKRFQKVSHLRGGVTQSAANTYTETSINTNINPLSNQIIAIHDVTFSLGNVDLVVDNDNVALQLLKQSKSGLVGIDDPDMIAQVITDVLLVTSGLTLNERIKTVHFDPPELIATDTLILGMSTVGQAAASVGSVDIRYTPMTVSDIEFAKLAKF